jgi:hypothetical protein
MYRGEEKSMPSRKQASPGDAAPAAATEPETPALEWMQECREWGVRAPVGPHGLTMRAINIGIYGEIPDEWNEMTRMPRGAYPVEGVPRIDLYALTKKSEVWAENSPELYEEAVQRRWNAQQDIPWETLEPQPPEMTLAMSQVCTELCQQAITEAEAIGNWLHKMCYGYHEVKDFLATQAFDAARHIEAFRQRALANGGTMGLESPGLVNRRIIEVRGGWTETALFLYILRGSLTLLLYRYGACYASHPADATLFRLAMQDKARHLAYGMAHLKYAITQKGSGYALGLQRLLVGAEQDLLKEMQDPVLWEALALLFGGGLRRMAAGMEVVCRLQQQYLEDYVRRLQWVGIAKTVENLAPGLSEYLTPVTE